MRFHNAGAELYVLDGVEAKEALEKHENAFEKALISNDWSKLKGG